MSYKLAVIGASKGGLRALKTIFRSLTEEFALPTVVVLHRSKDNDSELDAYLKRHARHDVVTIDDKMPLSPKTIYLAPADYHVMIEGNALALSVDDPVNYARPSIDVLFESAALAYTKELVAVILTGANSDGAAGAALVEENGGLVIIQDPSTADSRSMPQAAIAATKKAKVLLLDEIGPNLSTLALAAGG